MPSKAFRSRKDGTHFPITPPGATKEKTGVTSSAGEHTNPIADLIKEKEGTGNHKPIVDNDNKEEARTIVPSLPAQQTASVPLTTTEGEPLSKFRAKSPLQAKREEARLRKKEST